MATYQKEWEAQTQQEEDTNEKKEERRRTGDRQVFVVEGRPDTISQCRAQVLLHLRPQNGVAAKSSEDPGGELVWRCGRKGGAGDHGLHLRFEPRGVSGPRRRARLLRQRQPVEVEATAANRVAVL